jgi:uncharacterized membrane protein
VSDGRLRLVTAALALLGAAIAGYLSYTRLAETSIMCPTSGCAAVQQSEYSKLGSVPVAYIGVAGYLAIALAAASGRRAARGAGAALVLVAVAFAAYLLVAQVVLIDAVCVWCLASDAVLALLLAVTAFRQRRARV